MLGRGVGGVAASRAGPVARAVARMAQERSAANDPLGDAGAVGVPRPRRVGGSLGILDRLPARLADRLHVGVGAVPVAAPLPHVAGHVEEAVAVRRETLDRRTPLEAIRRRGSSSGRPPATSCTAAPSRCRARRPRRTRRPTARPALRTPTRLRSAGACRPSGVRRRRRPTRHARRAGRPCRRSNCRAPADAANSRRASTSTTGRFRARCRSRSAA